MKGVMQFDTTEGRDKAAVQRVTELEFTSCAGSRMRDGSGAVLIAAAVTSMGLAAVGLHYAAERGASSAPAGDAPSRLVRPGEVSSESNVVRSGRSHEESNKEWVRAQDLPVEDRFVVVPPAVSTASLRLVAVDPAQTTRELPVFEWIREAGGGFEIIRVDSLMDIAPRSVYSESLAERLNAAHAKGQLLAECDKIVTGEDSVDLSAHDREVLNQLALAERVKAAYHWIVTADPDFGGVRVRLLLRASSLPTKFSLDVNQGFVCVFRDAEGVYRQGLSSPYEVPGGRGFSLPSGARELGVAFVPKTELWRVALDARLSRGEAPPLVSLPLALPAGTVSTLSEREVYLAQQVLIGAEGDPRRITEFSRERPTIVSFGFPECGSCKVLARQLKERLDKDPRAFDLIEISAEVTDPSTSLKSRAKHPEGAFVIPFSEVEPTMLGVRGTYAHLAFPFSYVFVPQREKDQVGGAGFTQTMVVGARLAEIEAALRSQDTSPDATLTASQPK